MKLHHLFWAGMAVAISATPALALNTLKKIQVTDGSQVDLFFDGKVDINQVRTEFKQDIIQLSLEDVSVYPAKIHSVQGMDLTKVFAYQYTPKLTRCRLTVKGDAENYKERIQLKANGKVLSLRISGASIQRTASADTVSHSAAQAERPRGDESAGARAKTSDDEIGVQDSALLSKILGGDSRKEKAEAQDAKDEKRAEKSANRKTSAARSFEKAAARDPRQPLTGGKSLPSPMRPLGVLMGIVALLGAVAWLVKRGGKLEKHPAFGRFARNFAKLGLGQRSRLIEVLQTHHLGPKKSISVVKVAGRTLVLGITNESINLIAQLDGQAAAAAATGGVYDELGEELAQSSDLTSPNSTPSAAQRASNSMFDTLLAGAIAEPAVGVSTAAKPAAPRAPVNAAVAAEPALAAPFAATASSQAPMGTEGLDFGQRPASASVRAQIRSRLEGMKTL